MDVFRGISLAVVRDMPRLPRSLLLEPGLSLHKVWRGHNREWNLSEPTEKLTYLSMLNEEIVKQWSQLRALCLMSNHSHEVYSLDNVEEFSVFMRRHHGRYGQFFNKRHNRCGQVAQDRPKTPAIQDEDQEMRVTFYVHANPLRARMVKDANQYPWSTHRLYAFGKRAIWMKNVRFPKWYMELGRTWDMRQGQYRKLFDAFLRTEGFIKQNFSQYGIGDLRWCSRRRCGILELIKKKREAASKNHSPP
ncbi:MAG: transposase [Pseudomonadota bacterium]